MTLARQLGLVLALVLIVVFALAFVLSVESTRRFLAEQLASHAQDTATSLGLSLSPHAASGDTLLMESMVDAIFDRGYYRRIAVESLDGTSIVERGLPVRVHGVPEWFVRWLPLDTPSASAELMAGWRRGGRVLVKSHPGLAYRKLWDDALDLLGLTGAALAAALALLTAVLSLVLRPLGAVERQALAITEREFPVVDRIPRTRELRRVVLAMNRMTAKVETMLGEQQARAEALLEAVYVDPLTGLGNRRAFERDLARMVTQRERHAFGAAVLVRVRGLEALNREAGRDAGDALLVEAASRLAALAREHDAQIAHLGGSLFALIVPDLTRSDAHRVLEETIERLRDVAIGEREPAGSNAGLAYYAGGQSPAELLERVEGALANAQSAGANRTHLWDATETAGGRDVYHEERWRGVLRRVIDERAVVLALQPVRSADLSRLVHHEALARIRPGGGELVAAGVFFPMAARVRMTGELDRLVVRTALGRIEAEAGLRLAVNLARQSVREDGFAQWLGDEVARHPGIAERIYFEITEQTAVGEPEASAGLARVVRRAGAGLGVDHCGGRDLGLEYLRRLKVDYAKIDGAFVAEIDVDPDKQGYVRSLAEFCRLLDIETVAECVETGAQLETLRALGVSAVQGRHVGEPALG